MKKKTAFALTLLLTSIIYYTSISNNKSLTSLTQQEILSLINRKQNRDTRIISTSKAEELQLLHSRSRAVAFNSRHMDTLIQQMRKAVIAHYGLGLAAVQIGVPVRVVIMQQQIKGKDFFKVFINPEILSKSSTTQIFGESCLSLPNHDDHLIERSLVLNIRYQTLSGKIVKESVSHLYASVFQQEMDHLNGVLIMDYPNLGKERAQNNLSN